MSGQLTHELSIGYGLMALTKRLSSQGGWIQYGDELIDSNLPFGGVRMEKLAVIVDAMASRYEAAGRGMETVFFCFEEHFMALIFEGDLRLGLLFDQEQDESADFIEDSRNFLVKNRERLFDKIGQNCRSASTHWAKMEKMIRVVISSEFGPRKAEHIVNAALLANPLPQDVSKDKAESFAREIVKSSAHGSQRRILLAEFEQTLKAGF